MAWHRAQRERARAGVAGTLRTDWGTEVRGVPATPASSERSPSSARQCVAACDACRGSRPPTLSHSVATNIATISAATAK